MERRKTEAEAVIARLVEQNALLQEKVEVLEVSTESEESEGRRETSRAMHGQGAQESVELLSLEFE